MVFRKQIRCEACKTSSMVYLEEKELPPMSESYAVPCPSCRKEVVFQVGAVVVMRALPPGAPVAQPRVLTPG
jgi:hypothetical protein